MYDAPFPSDGGLTPTPLPALASVWSETDAAATGMTLSNDGLTVTNGGTGAWASVRGTISKASGKLYVEFLANAAIGAVGFEGYGFASSSFAPTSYLGSSNYSAGINATANNVSAGFTANYTIAAVPNSGDVWALAIDFAAGSIWIAKNNVWLNGDPAAGTLPVISFVPATVGALFPALNFFQQNAGEDIWTLQPTAASQKYTPPSGFEAWDLPMSNGPPVTSAPVPPSIAGIPQPVFDSGSASAPATPIPITGHPIIPPPTIGDPEGFPVFPPVTPNTAPVPVPVGPLVGPAVAPAAVPPSIPGVAQPQYKTGSATVPASLFPEFTTTPPSPPIVFANIQKIGAIPPPLPSTPGQNPPPIVASAVPTIPQLPWPPIPPEPPPVNVNPPVIQVATNLHVGSTLNGSPGSWDNMTPGAWTWEWLRDGSPIAGATGVSYVLVTADVGFMIGLNITATGPGGEASMVAQPVGPVTNLPAPTNTVAPVVSGLLVEGSTLTRTTGTWTGSPTFATIWQRGGTNIAGATAATYVTVAADVGLMIGCVVTGTNAGGSHPAPSNTLGPITAAVGEDPEDDPPEPAVHRVKPKKKR